MVKRKRAPAKATKKTPKRARARAPKAPKKRATPSTPKKKKAATPRSSTPPKRGKKKTPKAPPQRVPKVPAKKRKSGPKPRLPRAPSRARSDADRARAYRLREKLSKGDGITPAQDAWLTRYEEAVDRGSRARSARATLAKNRGALGDAEDIADRLARWLGESRGEIESGWQRNPVPGKPGTAWATVGVAWELERGEPRQGLPDGAPDLGGAIGPDRAMTLRVEIESKEGKRWVTAVAFTERTWDAEVDFADACEDIADAYQADAISAISVYVGGFS